MTIKTPSEKRKYQNLNSYEKEDAFFDRFKTWEEIRFERYNC